MLESVFLPKTIKIWRNMLFIDREKRLQVNKHRSRHDVFTLSASNAPAEDISLSCSLHFSVSQDNLDIIFTTCFPVLHTGDENINEMPDHWWLTGCWGEEKKLCTSAKRREPLSDKRQGYQASVQWDSFYGDRQTDALVCFCTQTINRPFEFSQAWMLCWKSLTQISCPLDP